MKVFYIEKLRGISEWGGIDYERISPYFKSKESALNFAKEKGYEITDEDYNIYSIGQEDLKILD